MSGGHRVNSSFLWRASLVFVLIGVLVFFGYLRYSDRFVEARDQPSQFQVQIDSIEYVSEPDRYMIDYTITYLGSDPIMSNVAPSLEERTPSRTRGGRGSTGMEPAPVALKRGDRYHEETSTLTDLSKHEQEFYLLGPADDGKGDVLYGSLVLGPNDLK